MYQEATAMTSENMQQATARASERVQARPELAKAAAADAFRERRLVAHRCKACFYATRIGGAAMTTKPCMCCKKDQLYSSTATDALCDACAEKHSLCKKCGGDLEMDVNRQDWPKPDSNV